MQGLMSEQRLLPKKEIQKGSISNLKYLAKELAINYYNSSIPFERQTTWLDNNILNEKELLSTQQKEGKEEDRPKIKNYLHHQFGVPAESFFLNDDGNKPNQTKDSSEVWGRKIYSRDKKTFESRNILVIGSGASHDAYSSIPLGSEAVKQLYTKLTVWEDSDIKVSFADIAAWALAEIGVEELPFTIDRVKREKIEDKHILLHKISKFKHEYEKLRLYAPISNIDKNPLDFETSLVLLSRFMTNDSLKEELGILFDAKYGTSLCYQIIAHMLRHRMIDIVINFNFDELLDQCIKDQLGDGNYYTVVTEGDASRIAEDFEFEPETSASVKRLAYPLYIKPHGTISNKTSLRFTKEQYHELPERILDQLAQLIEVDRKNPRKVNLINIGFELESLEFKKLLNRYLPNGSNLFWIYHREKDEGNNSKKTVEEKKLDRFQEILPDHTERSLNLYLIDDEIPLDAKAEVAGEYPKLGRIFHQLFLETTRFFKEEFQPVGIYKYLIEEALFGSIEFQNELLHQKEVSDEFPNPNPNPYPREYYRSLEYFQNKTVFELWVAAMKCNGIIDTSQMVNTLAGQYYHRYFKEAQKEKENSGNGPKSFMDFVEIVNFGGNKNLSPFGVFNTDLPSPKEGLFKMAQSTFETNFEDMLTGEFKSFFLKSLRNENKRNGYINLFSNLVDSVRFEILPDYQGVEYHKFKNFLKEDLLKTDLAVAYHVYKKMTSDKISDVYIVSEQGHFLKRFKKWFDDKKDINLCIILASNDIVTSNSGYRVQRMKNSTNFAAGGIVKDEFWVKEVEENFKITETNWKSLRSHMLDKWKITHRNNLNILFMDINAHNHHMMIFTTIDRKRKKERLNKVDELAIYYYLRGQSYRINPIKLKEEENIDALLEKFCDYYDKACEHSGINPKSEKSEHSWLIPKYEEIISRIRKPQ